MASYYTWQLLNSSLPTAMNQRDGLAGCVLNSKMYALGGWKSGAGLGTTYNSVLYSTDGITWTASAKTPTWDGRHCFPVVVHNSRIYVLGGDVNKGYYQPNVHSWTGLETDEWVTEDTAAPWGNRMGHFAFSFNGYIYVGGGQTYTNITSPPTQFYNDLWRSATGANGTWELVTNEAPYGIRGFLMGCPPEIDGEIYFVGSGTYDTTDFTTREYKNDVFAMDVNHNFRCVTHGKNSPLTKQMYHCVTALNDNLIVLGGYAGADQRTAFISTDKGKTWSSLSTPPWAARHAAMSIVYNGEIYFGTGMYAADMWKLKETVFGAKVHVGAIPDGTTGLASTYTVIDKSTQLTNGLTVTEMGYWRNSSGSMTPKIVKQIGTSNVFDVVWSGSAVTHNGGGYQSFDIPDYAVPNDGNTYRIAFAFSYPSADLYSFAGNGRWLKAGNITGTGQTFTHYADGSCGMTWTEL